MSISQQWHAEWITTILIISSKSLRLFWNINNINLCPLSLWIWTFKMHKIQHENILKRPIVFLISTSCTCKVNSGVVVCRLDFCTSSWGMIPGRDCVPNWHVCLGDYLNWYCFHQYQPRQDGWMNGVLGHFFALSRLNWAGDNLD